MECQRFTLEQTITDLREVVCWLAVAATPAEPVRVKHLGRDKLVSTIEKSLALHSTIEWGGARFKFREARNRFVVPMLQ